MKVLTAEPGSRLLWCGMLAAWLGWPLLQPGLADADDALSRVRRGAFIVATEKLANTMFEQTVILITHHGKTGTMGLTVNRPSEASIREIFPEVERLRARGVALFLGGPVSPHAIFVLVRTDRPGAGMERIAKGIYLSTDIEAVGDQLPGASPGASTRAFAGRAGWAPGQLEEEILRGDWIVAWENPIVAFAKDWESLWKRLLESWSGRWI